MVAEGLVCEPIVAVVGVRDVTVENRLGDARAPGVEPLSDETARREDVLIGAVWDPCPVFLDVHALDRVLAVVVDDGVAGLDAGTGLAECRSETVFEAKPRDRRRPRRYLEDVDFQARCECRADAVCVVVTEKRRKPDAVVTVALYLGTSPPLGSLGGVTDGVVENSLRQGAFQVTSLLTSTGYATSNFVEWGPAGEMTLLIAMFVGGSAGSTGGGIKVIRWVIALKAVRRELVTSAHPDAVTPVRLRNRIVDENAVRGVLVFTFLYLFVFAIATLLITLDAARIGYTLTGYEAISASIATLGNIGPGFGSLGPFGSYLQFPWTSKLLMVFLMWFGRLEIIPVLLVFTGSFWNR